MYKIVAFVTLVYHFGFVISNFRTCVPNTQFILNDRLCYCDGNGHWTDASCLHVSHKQLCQPGQIVWHGCSQCTCQDNGRLLCNNVNCPDDKRIPTTKGTIINNIGHWCTPLRIYYIDCSVCVCPQSGRTANIHCVKDSSCTALRTPSITDLLETNKNTCRPKVLYVFYCLQCLCSDDGFFTMNNCVETCPSKPKTSIMRTCTPHKFYKNDCNVCLCPRDGIHSDASCTKEVCDGTHKFKVLQALTESKSCISHQFTTPMCYYCQCNSDGTLNQQTCLELNCLVMNSHENINTCSPGEIVTFCTQCFCLRNGTTQQQYCTTSCSYRSKIQVLEKVFKDSITKRQLDWNAFDTTSNALTCKQNTVYTENGKYCLCPDSQTKEKSCLVPVKKTFDFENPASQFTFKETKINIDFKKPCVPSTFIEFDCNTCFCSKNGTIDPNWCTYDDCESIRAVQNAQKVDSHKETDKCNPGSIIRIDCNYCICPETGMSKDKACTTNHCADVEQPVSKDNIHCAPLEYYEVDCNVCFCPNDGVKNVAKCTKNVCDDNLLRSDECGPGRLFTEGCNICICPPDGSRRDRVCTENGCKKNDTTWKKIYQYTNSILEDLPVDVAASEKNLDLCFPGEEFVSDGLFCVCPDMGFKTYAACFGSVEGYDDVIKAEKDEGSDANVTLSFGFDDSFVENLPTKQKHGCYVENNMTARVTGTKCVSGVGYIKGCQQCICSSEVDTIEYCRPLNTTECSTFGTLFFMRSIGAGSLLFKSCDLGDTVENVCNKCVCGTKGVYICKRKNCKITEEIYPNKPKVCQPNRVYHLGATDCLCSPEGEWPHQICYDIFKNLSTVTKKTCKPGGYVKVECNVCRCNEDGQVDKKRCTLNECEKNILIKRRDQPELITLEPRSFGKCLSSNWYSLGPCQFCFCHPGNILVCNTKFTFIKSLHEVPVGKTQLFLCGPNLVRDLIGLVASNQTLNFESNEDKDKDEDEYEDEDSDDHDGKHIDSSKMRFRTSDDGAIVENYQDENVATADTEGNSDEANDDKIEIFSLGRRNAKMYDVLKRFLKDRRQLTLNAKANCVPETTVRVKCNFCHCLKNGKLLCTDKKCD